MLLQDELALSPVQVAALVEVNNRIMVEMQSLQDLQQQTLQELHVRSACPTRTGCSHAGQQGVAFPASA